MRPYLRYAGVVFIAALLAFAFNKGAHGEERHPDPACMAALTVPATAVHVWATLGVPRAMSEHLIRSDPSFSGQDRWLLLELLDVLIARPDTNPAAVLSALCALPQIPTAAGTYRSEFDRPKDI